MTYWRRRLAASDRPNRIFDAVKAVVAQTGVLTGKTRRALDSTVLEDAVATQDTVTQLIAAIRRVRRQVPGAAAVVAEHCTAHDYADPGKPTIAWDDEQARAALVDALVGDAHRLLGHLPEQELGPKAAEAVALLALVAGQDVEPVAGSDGTDGRWRIAQRVAEDRVISVHDPDARHAHKTVSRRQDGFKAHLAVEPDTGLITGCQLTAAAGPDASEAMIGAELLAGEPSTGEPAGLQVLADLRLRHRPDAGRAGRRRTRGDHQAVAGPPAGPRRVHHRRLHRRSHHRNRHLPRPDTPARSAAAARSSSAPPAAAAPSAAGAPPAAPAAACKLRDHDALSRAHRRRAADPAFQTLYRRHRPMVERSLAWLTRGNRRCATAAPPRTTPGCTPAPQH